VSKNQYHNIERPTIATGLQDAKFFRELLEPLNNGIQDTSIESIDMSTSKLTITKFNIEMTVKMCTHCRLYGHVCSVSFMPRSIGKP
jgi:hypothetical protein